VLINFEVGLHVICAKLELQEGCPVLSWLLRVSSLSKLGYIWAFAHYGVEQNDFAVLKALRLCRSYTVL